MSGSGPKVLNLHAATELQYSLGNPPRKELLEWMLLSRAPRGPSEGMGFLEKVPFSGVLCSEGSLLHHLSTFVPHTPFGGPSLG